MTMPPNRKRKRSTGTRTSNVIDLTADDSDCEVTIVEKPKAKRRKNEKIEEKRLRRYRTQPPQSFEDVYNRALTQRSADLICVLLRQEAR
jgi:hypothetical protein